MENNTIVYCLEHPEVLGCLECPQYKKVNDSLLECRKQRVSEAVTIIEDYQRIKCDHNKIEKISAILKTAKADPTRDEYAEYYLDAIEEVIRWIPI